MNGLARFVLALVLVLVSAVVGAGRAEAYVDWRPPSLGSGEDVTGVLETGAYPNVSGQPGFRYGFDPLTPASCTAVMVEWIGVTTLGVEWRMDWVGTSCPGTGSSGRTAMTTLGQPRSYKCDAGAWTVYEGSAGYVGTGFPLRMRASFAGLPGCTVESSIQLMWDWSGYDAAAGYVNIGRWYGATGSAVQVTVTCASSSGVQIVTGYGFAPSAECPAGTRAVGVSVTGPEGQVGSWQIPDASSRPALAAACMQGECSPKVKVGGYSCDPTMYLDSDPDWCKRAASGGSLPSDAGCEWQHPTLGVIVLARSDCASWLEGIAGPPVETPENSDSGIIVEWLQRILQAVKDVKSAVDAARDAIVQAVEGVREAVEGIESPGGGDGGAGGPGPGSPGAPSAQPGPLTVKFQPWLNVWSSLTSGLQSTGTCQGPPLTLTLAGAEYTLYLLEACDGARAQLAAVSRAAMSVLLVVVMILSTVRVLSSSLGLQLKGGE